MSYYRRQGYRIEEAHRFDEEEKDFYRVFEINFVGLKKKVSGRPEWASREDAEEAAQEIIQEKPEVVVE